jgi:hypothetical protein
MQLSKDLINPAAALSLLCFGVYMFEGATRPHHGAPLRGWGIFLMVKCKRISLWTLKDQMAAKLADAAPLEPLSCHMS